MALQNLDRVLRQFSDTSRPLWQKSPEFQRILGQWSTIVGTTLCLHTRPHRLDRKVLKVATSSTVWAQNLQFERHRLLAKIQDQLQITLKDIQFSTAYWRLPSPVAESFASHQEQQIWQAHPSRVSSENLPNHLNNVQNLSPPSLLNSECDRSLKERFQHWAKACQTRDRTLPRCPRCHSPTPAGELERWQICSFCVSQQWH
ncbi:MAG: DciA family protein [Prochlorotrichaceae cyanobacterium]|jgi:predicted nucleic acid-binding Zn ribbon protein